jgi:hypothetical protein
MDLFSDILPPLQAPVPIGTVAQQVARSIIPTHTPRIRSSAGLRRPAVWACRSRA